MSIKMIVSDMDGTLLGKSHEFDPATRDYLRDKVNEGKIVTLASGRSYPKMIDYAKELNIDKNNQGFLISMNGQEIYDMQTNECIVGPKINPNDLKDLIELGLKYHVDVIVFLDGKEIHFARKTTILLRKFHAFITHRDADDALEGKMTQVEKFDPNKYDFTQEVGKLAYVGHPIQMKAFIKAANKRFSKNYQVIKVINYWTEVMPNGVSKGAALKQLLTKLAISSDEVIAFGDGENDLDMLASVKYGIAMGNAFQSVKNVAYYVTDECDNQGVLKALKKYEV